MLWLSPSGLARRPLVVVEDHLQHVGELLEALTASDPSLAALATVLCLDRAGPDTSAAASRWLATYPALQVAALLEGADRVASSPRLLPLDAALVADAHRF